jgi:hypothetical protein
MNRNVAAGVLVLTLAICAVEINGLYFGGWGRGRLVFQSGWQGGCVGCIFLGSRYFWADAGDEFVLSYDVKPTRGKLRTWISPASLGRSREAEGSTNVIMDVSGVWTKPLNRRGWYYLVLSGASDRQGYDVNFRVRWRIRRGG